MPETYPTYDVTVRLAGDVAQEVIKEGVTAPEVMLLQKLHGQDAVCRGKRAEPVTYDLGDVGLRLQLALHYGDDLIDGTFGPAHLGALPKTVPGFDHILNLSKPANVDVAKLKEQLRAEILAEMAAGQAELGPVKPPVSLFSAKGGGKDLLTEPDPMSADHLLDGPDKPGSPLGGAKVE